MNPSAKNFADPMLPFTLDEAAETFPVTGKQPSYIADHRQRLRARFMAGGAAAMPEYELLGTRPVQSDPAARRQTASTRSDEAFRGFQSCDHGTRSAPA